MNQIWALNIDDYIAICEIAKSRGLKTGESMEAILFEYVKEKGIKPLGATELDTDLLTENLREKGYKILNINEIQRRKDNGKE